MDNTGAIRMLVIYSFTANEGISILENWVEMKMPIPDKIKNILYSLSDDAKKNEWYIIDNNLYLIETKFIVNNYYCYILLKIVFILVGFHIFIVVVEFYMKFNEKLYVTY